MENNFLLTLAARRSGSSFKKKPSSTRLEGDPASLRVFHRSHDAIECRCDLETQRLCSSRNCDTDQRGAQAILNGGDAVFVSDESLHSGKDRFHDKLHMVVYKNNPAAVGDFP